MRSYPPNQPVYKTRVRNTDIKKGKSGAYRLIYKFDKENKAVTLLLFCFKGDKEGVSKSEILEALKSIDKGLFDEV